MSNLSNAIHEALQPTPFHVELGLKGKFEIEVRHHKIVGEDEDGYPIYEYTGSDFPDDPHNLVTNSGLDLMGTTSGNCINGIAVGTSNSTPAAGNTALGAGVGYSTNLTTQTISYPSTVAPYVIQNSYTFTFAVGGAVGNIAEIAAIPSGSTATTGVIFSRALIQVGGVPGTIPLLSTDQLIVTYLLQTILTADITGTFNSVIDGVSTAIGFTIRPIGMYVSSQAPCYGQKNKVPTANGGGSFVGWYPGIGTGTTFMSVTSAPGNSGTQNCAWGNGGTIAVTTYVSGSYSNTQTFGSPTAHPATGGISHASFCFGQWFAFQMLFSTPVPYLTTQTLSWPVSVTWANAS